MHVRQGSFDKNKNMVPSTHNIPEIDTIGMEKHSVIIDYMNDKQLTETYHMIKKAAKYGHGFGFDEFSTEENFRSEVTGSRCFAVMSKEEGVLLASVILAQSKFYRGANEVVDPFIIVKYSVRCKGFGEYCMRKAIELSTMLGYTAMYADTFSNNKAMIRIIEKIGGFKQVGCLPIGGCLPSGKYVSSLIYFRSLVREDRNNT